MSKYPSEYNVRQNAEAARKSAQEAASYFQCLMWLFVWLPLGGAILWVVLGGMLGLMQRTGPMTPAERERDELRQELYPYAGETRGGDPY